MCANSDASVPGGAEISIETLPNSTLPADLRGLGNDLVETGEGKRILPHAITEMVITEGSTVPIRVLHAGIARVFPKKTCQPSRSRGAGRAWAT
jgi:hypothetical protein